MNSLNRLRETWPLDERRSQAPHAALWHELFRFTGHETAKILFRESHAESNFLKPFLNAISLADDMVKAWEDVDDDFTGSVLLYYGALWLGNAIAFVTLNGEQLDRRQAAHGLEVKFDFAKTFPLLEATINLTADTGAFGIINGAFGGSSIAGQTFLVKDLITAIPEMRHSLPHVHLSSRAIEAQWIGDVPGDSATEFLLRAWPHLDVDLLVDHTPNPSWLRDNLAIGVYLNEQSVRNDPALERRITWNSALFSDEPRSAAEELLATSIEHDGRRFFLPTIKRRVVSEYAMYLGIMFVIGHLARYYPDYWIDMQRERSPEFFLIREFLDLAEDKIPRLALNHLQRRTFAFYSA